MKAVLKGIQKELKVEWSKGHTVEWKDAVFIVREKHWKGQKKTEALYINAQNPKRAVDKNSILNLEKGLDVDAIWGDFNLEFRKIMSKKIKRTD